MTITESGPDVSEVAPDVSPEDAAASYLETLANGESTEATPEIEATAETPKPEDDAKAEIARERQKVLELHAKTNQQHQALTRRAAKLEEKEQAVTAKAAELEKLSTITEIVAYVAKVGGKSEHDVWLDVADQIRNGGKRSPESETSERLARLERERESERAESKRLREAQEAEKSASEAQRTQDSWKDQTAELAKSNAEKWPTLAGYPPTELGTEALSVIEEYFEQTGLVATQEQVLDYLEGQKKPAAPPAEAPKVANGPAPKRRAETLQTPTNLDASRAPTPRAKTDQELEEDAVRYLESLTG